MLCIRDDIMMKNNLGYEGLQLNKSSNVLLLQRMSNPTVIIK